jgi:uncharacterized protein YecE (DUF72 family)
VDFQPETFPDIRIGTSGFDYPEWEDVLYSKGISRKGYLGSYSEVFSTLELNFSYYTMPKAENIRELISRTRKPIDFSIKANQALTHKINPTNWKESVSEYTKGISPLLEEGRLCAVLLEFPFSFHYHDDERRYLDKVLKELAAFPLVVEFRSAEWFNSRVFDGLKERRVGLCALDMPRLEGLPPLSDLVTAEIAYVRFHGRNKTTWWNGDAGTRYEYLYSKDELETWIPRLEAMSTQAKRIRIYFNNHRNGAAATNAKELVALATEAKLMKG